MLVTGAGWRCMGMLGSLFAPETLESIWQALHSIDPQWALLAVFVVLFSSGCGLPLPEDIPLTFTGIMLGLKPVQAEFGGFWPALILVALVSYTSIITGDLVAYWLGKTYGRKLVRVRPFKWALTPKRLRRLDHWYDKFGNWTVFLGRMVAGVRFVTFFTAGMTRLAVTRFVLFDSLAALLTVPIWIGLGLAVGTHFQEIGVWMGKIGSGVWITLGVLVGLFVTWKLVRKLLNRKQGVGNETQEVDALLEHLEHEKDQK